MRSVPKEITVQQHPRKRSGHSAKSAGGWLQLNTHASYVCGFAWRDMVHGSMVYTERAKTAAVSCGTSHTSAVSRAGSGITQWLERRNRDWKVAGSNPCRRGGRVFFSRVNFLCWLLFRYPFHPRVTAVALKDPGHSAKSAGGRLQLNTRTLCGFEWSQTVTWCIAEWCTQNLRRNGSISSSTSLATTTERYRTPLPCIRAIQG